MEDHSFCHVCIKNLCRYGSTSEQMIFKDGGLRKEKVCTANLSAFSLSEISTCLGQYKNLTSMLDYLQ